MRCRRVLSVLALAFAFAGGGRAHAQPKAADPLAIEEAKRHMKAGAALYNDPAGHKCEEALREFTKAYELSGSLNARKGMAICNLELERDGDAIRDYTAYLDGKGATIDPAEKKQIEADLAALRAAAATIEITADRKDVRITDVRTPSKGFPIRNSYVVEQGKVTLQIHPGQHTFTAIADGFPEQVWQVEVANGASLSRAFSFRAPKEEPAIVVRREPPPPPPIITRPVPTSVWVTAGVGGALGIAWGALAVRATLLNASYEKKNGNAPRAELEDLRGNVKAANVTADVFLVAAGATLATSAVLYLTRPLVTKPGKPGSTGLSMAPVVSSSCVGGVFGGSF